MEQEHQVLSHTYQSLLEQRVKVNRHGQQFEAIMTHQLFKPIIKDGQSVGRGEPLGIGIRDDRGFELYAQMDMLELIA